MKRLLIASSFAFSSLAFGQAAPADALRSSLTLYGLIDTGVEYITHVGPANSSLTRMPSLTASSPSRWGLRGSEDLGGGLRALFVLESGFAPDTGALNQGGRMFGRQSLVGLSGPWGTLSFGRQYTMYFWSLTGADVLGPNSYGLAALDSYIPNARADNSVAYQGRFGNFTLGGTYSLGRDTVNAGPSPAGTNCAGELAGDSKACREFSGMVKYDSRAWGAAIAMDRLYGGSGAFGGLTSSSLTDTRTSVNGYINLASVKIAGGLIHRQNDGSITPRSDIWYLGAVYPLNEKWTADAQASKLSYKSSSNDATLLVARATYSLSKRTAAYVMVGHIKNGGSLALTVSSGSVGSNPVAGRSQSAVMVGLRHSF